MVPLYVLLEYFVLVNLVLMLVVPFFFLFLHIVLLMVIFIVGVIITTAQCLPIGSSRLRPDLTGPRVAAHPPPGTRGRRLGGQDR